MAQYAVGDVLEKQLVELRDPEAEAFTDPQIDAVFTAVFNYVSAIETSNQEATQFELAITSDLIPSMQRQFADADPQLGVYLLERLRDIAVLKGRCSEFEDATTKN